MDKSKKVIFIFLGIVVLLLVVINGISYAKYASKSAWNYYLKSKGFYFESETLGVNSKTNVNNLWDGERVYFDISNYLSDSKVTDFDINYTVTCTTNNSSNCYINGTNSSTYQATLSHYKSCINDTEDGVDTKNMNQVTCESNGYTYKTSKSTSNLYFTVDDDSDVAVTITVTATSPYTKTLTGVFNLHKNVGENERVKHNVNDHSDYYSLVVSNPSSSSSCVRASWDSSKLHIDVDTNDLESYDTSSGFINEIEFVIAGNTSEEFIFYGTGDNLEITNSSFTLEEFDGC